MGCSVSWSCGILIFILNLVGFLIGVWYGSKTQYKSKIKKSERMSIMCARCGTCYLEGGEHKCDEGYVGYREKCLKNNIKPLPVEEFMERN